MLITKLATLQSCLQHRRSKCTYFLSSYPAQYDIVILTSMIVWYKHVLG